MFFQEEERGLFLYHNLVKRDFIFCSPGGRAKAGIEVNPGTSCVGPRRHGIYEPHVPPPDQKSFRLQFHRKEDLNITGVE